MKPKPSLAKRIYDRVVKAHTANEMPAITVDELLDMVRQSKQDEAQEKDERQKQLEAFANHIVANTIKHQENEATLKYLEQKAQEGLEKARNVMMSKIITCKAIFEAGHLDRIEDARSWRTTQGWLFDQYIGTRLRKKEATS